MSDQESSPDKKAAPASSPADKLRDLLADFPNAPSADQIESMKSIHGDVFLSALSDDEVFLFRSLTRKEHRDLNTKAAQGIIPQESFEEEVLKVCLLWQSIKNLDTKAGTIPSLFEQVMQNSNFLPPQVLSQLVTKL